MVVAQFFDFGTFFTMVHRLGPSAEANPIVLHVFDAMGMPGILLAKLALTIFVAGVGVLLATRPTPRERWVGAVVVGWGILAGLIGGWSNSMTMGPL